MQDEIYTVDQLAKVFSRSPRTIWKWAATGKIPKGIKISHKSHYWRRSEIEDCINNKRTA